MKPIIALIIKIQVLSLVSTADFDFSLNNFPDAERKFKRAVRSTCLQPSVTPDKNYVVQFPQKNYASDAEPRKTVPQSTIIKSHCNKGYAYDYQSDASTEHPSVCSLGTWQPPILKCKRICNNFSHFSHFKLSCYEYFGGPKIRCDGLLLEKAVVFPKCQEKFHPDKEVKYNYSTCRENGAWDKPFFKCVPDCGAAGVSIKLIAGGLPEKRGGAPWNVAIYSTQYNSEIPQFICGGTLISAELVVSAAHCFYDEVFRTNIDSKYFFLIVGKITLDHKIQDFGTTQTYKLKDIIYFPDTTFRGDVTNYVADIVILQLPEKVSFSRDVQLACLALDDEERFNPGENVMGKLSGFGETTDGSLAPVLLSTYLPFMSYNTCLKKVREEFLGAITVDKFCAGSENGTGARRGDSGGGVLFIDEITGLYHLRGVISIKDMSASSIATCTDVYYYKSWISKTMDAIEHKTDVPLSDSRQCVLPPIKPGMTYTVHCPIEEDCGARPEEKVMENTVLKPKCKSGYAQYKEGRVSNNYTTIHTCFNGAWAPEISECKRICDELSSNELDFTCFLYIGGPKVPCSRELLAGVVAAPTCKLPFYHPKTRVTYRHIKCEADGTWNQELFECQPDNCGMVRNSISSIKSPLLEERGGSPWHVVIYRKNVNSSIAETICAGTLITDKLVISAAHCFFDEALQQNQDIKLFHVIVGKATRDYTKPDYETTKVYSLKKIYFPDTPFGSDPTNSAADIVILQLSDRVSFSWDVLPACLPLKDLGRFNPGENVKGKLSGFGATGSFALALHTVQLSFTSSSECLKKVGIDFKSSFTEDKFCASSELGPDYYIGNGGAGLLFPDPKSDGRYYLRGVTSTLLKPNLFITLFTDISQHIPWIKRIVSSANHFV